MNCWAYLNPGEKMAEPTASTAFGLTALSIAFIGPMAGPYALIAASALGGAMWPLSAATTLGKTAGAMLLVRCTITALLLTAFLSTLLDNWLQVAGLDARPAVAFAIGALGNGWRPVFDALGSTLSAILNRTGSKQ